MPAAEPTAWVSMSRCGVTWACWKAVSVRLRTLLPRAEAINGSSARSAHVTLAL